jgi:monomeric isocitrate dehydrogenase
VLFTPVTEKFTANKDRIVVKLLAVQGSPGDIGGYYQPDDAKNTYSVGLNGQELRNGFPCFFRPVAT